MKRTATRSPRVRNLLDDSTNRSSPLLVGQILDEGCQLGTPARQSIRSGHERILPALARQAG
jgi:hypothetical protein